MILIKLCSIFKTGYPINYHRIKFAVDARSKIVFMLITYAYSFR